MLGATRLEPDLPYAGPIGTIALDPRNAREIAVASQGGGVFESNDGGARWHHVDGLPSVRVDDLAYSFDGTLVATTRKGYLTGVAGIWARNSSTRQWRRVFDACEGAGIAVGSDAMYVATGCGLARSSDGTHWKLLGHRALWSVAPLTNGTILAGTSDGFWFSRDGGTTWSRERTGIGNPGSVRALASDPRGGGRAYAFTAGNRLFQTRDGGAHWRALPIDAGNFSCGGRPFVKTRAEGGRVELYVGNRCVTSVASFAASGEATGAPLVWTQLEGSHVDTQDLAFPLDVRGRWYLSSDGGLDVSRDARNFARLAGPREGLDAHEIASVSLLDANAGAPPNLYLATWHNRLWALHELEPIGSVRWEGFGLATRGEQVTYALCGGCANRISDPRFKSVAPFRDATPGTRPPVPFGNDGYVQQDATGLAVTYDTGATWRHVATIDAPMHDVPRLAGEGFVQAVQLGTYASGLQRVGLAGAAMRGFGSFGVVTTSFAWYEVYGVSFTDPRRIVAPDAQSGDIKMSIDGGNSWRPIAGLAARVSQRGRYRMGTQAADRIATLVSVVSFCPQNGSAVVLGTRESGAYYSTDAGETWSLAPESYGIQNATSVAWQKNCREALIGTYGRGVWKVAVAPASSRASSRDEKPTTLATHVHPPFAITSGIVQEGERVILPEQSVSVRLVGSLPNATFAIDGRGVTGTAFRPPNGNWPLGHHYVTLKDGKRAVWSTEFIVP